MRLAATNGFLGSDATLDRWWGWVLNAPVEEPRREEGDLSVATQRTRPCVEELFAHHAALVLRTVRNLGARGQDAEDATQEVFLVAHRKLAQLDPNIDPRWWLLGIARRVAAAHRRKAHVRRERLVDPPAGALVSQAAQEDDVTRTWRRQVLHEALDRLDDKKRAVFVLYELEGLNMPEIAVIEGCPLQTAYSRHRAARTVVEAHVLTRVAGEGTK